MYQLLVFIGIVIIACTLTNRLATKLPVPSLLVFVALGMLFGVNGPFHIRFDNFELTEQVCCFALLFIMFYGGFNTNIEHAKPVALPAVLLSTVGVVITAGITAAFSHYVLGLSWIMSLLLGSVLGSTDAASVFSVLREHKLSLKDGTASLLEIESGSNDPLAYMLTVVLSALAAGHDVNVAQVLVLQIGLGIVFGLAIGKAAAWLLDNVRIDMEQGENIFLIAIALVAYALPCALGGSGFLSVYLAGIVLGNSDIPAKSSMAHLFDLITEIAEMAIFFLLGLLVTPIRLPEVILPAAALVIFMVLIARPIASTVILVPFGANKQKIALTSWAGLRGAASVVFSLYAVVEGVSGARDLFDLVFLVAVISIILQGSLLPTVAYKLDMVDANANVMMTFNDYAEETPLSFVKLKVGEGHPFIGKTLAEIGSLESLLVVMILRHGSNVVIPNGQTVIEQGDLLVLAAHSFEEHPDIALKEFRIGPKHRWNNKFVRELGEETKRFTIVMIKRGEQTIIPNGDTQILEGDDAVVATLG